MQLLGRYGAWVPVITGLSWLGYAADAGWLGYALAALPGGFLLTTGVAALLWPGDPRPLQVGALAAAVGTLLGFVATAWAGVSGGLVLIGLSTACFVSFGVLSLVQQVSVDDLPEAQRSLAVATGVAVDEALLGFVVSLALQRGYDALHEESKAALEYFSAHGWLEKPADYHVPPPPLETVQLHPRKLHGTAFEHLRFESGYEPRREEPGADRYRAYGPCRTGHAWVMRHASPAGPWLLCVHGLQMGWPQADLFAFRAARLHQQLGLNLLFPILPFHGPRRVGQVSGQGFVSERVLDTVHALAQAAWDMRRLLSWIRSQGATRIGVYGMSLGGYNAGLLASLDASLACVIAGVPAVDFAALTWQHAPLYELRRFERQGLSQDMLEAVLRPVAPLALTPKVPSEGRYIFAGSADRMVPPDQARALWQHWQQPRIQWYPGSHVSFLLQPEVRRFIDAALTDSGLSENSRDR